MERVATGIKGEQVVAAMTRLESSRGAPRTIRVDNDPEFISTALDRWAYENRVTLDFQPTRHTHGDNAFVESLNGACATGAWTGENRIAWHIIAPGKPMQTASARASTGACATIQLPVP